MSTLNEREYRREYRRSVNAATLLYVCGWLPGVIANWRLRRRYHLWAGVNEQKLPWAGVVEFQFWAFTVTLPLLALLVCLVALVGRTGASPGPQSIAGTWTGTLLQGVTPWRETMVLTQTGASVQGRRISTRADGALSVTWAITGSFASDVLHFADSSVIAEKNPSGLTWCHFTGDLTLSVSGDVATLQGPWTAPAPGCSGTMRLSKPVTPAPFAMVTPNAAPVGGARPTAMSGVYDGQNVTPPAQYLIHVPGVSVTPLRLGSNPGSYFYLLAMRAMGGGYRIYAAPLHPQSGQDCDISYPGCRPRDPQQVRALTVGIGKPRLGVDRAWCAAHPDLPCLLVYRHMVRFGHPFVMRISRSDRACLLTFGASHGSIGFTMALSTSATCAAATRAATPVVDALLAKIY